ncbi:hypothetical protein PSAB6_620026 [Paraburkholderia sabiae]|nr:hypothetical protein PSAB6_620026 [Paraburkholderia sabiae]
MFIAFLAIARRISMRVENFGPYQLELSAMQFIHNGGWAAFASVRKLDDGAEAAVPVLPFQQVVDHTVFATEAAAIAAARGAVVAMIPV